MGGTNITKRNLFLFTFFITLFLLETNINIAKADSSINNYIINNKIQPSQIQYQEGTFSVWQGYRYGVGQPEGIVVHETSEKDVTAQQFTDRFNQSWQKQYTYVHAFVDNNEILNIHNTDYTVWGAGPTANSRFVQVELCRVNNYDDFAHSLANDAFYIASKLIQYHLPDVPGQTVFSHKQTSDLWHETKHQDPDYYFSTWGYDMNQFNDLILSYYNNLKAFGKVYNPGDYVINVQNTQGDFVPLVSINNGTTHLITNRGLANNTAWYTDKKQTVNGVVYQRVATNEWVAENYKH